MIERRIALGGGRQAHLRFTEARDGDLRVSQPAGQVTATRRGILDLPWTWLHQVHGATVVTVAQPGQHAGADADAAVTAVPGAALAIHTADCVPVALVAEAGVVGAVHAGWRGLAAGVVEATVDRMRDHGATDVQAVVGPCIHPECYEFGPAELDQVAATYGPEVRATTTAGTPALDMPTAVTVALHRAGVAQVDVVPHCTACDQRFFSHRARGDTGRQALLVWIEG